MEEQLADMGFSPERIAEAVYRSHNDMSKALNFLIEGELPAQEPEVVQSARTDSPSSLSSMSSRIPIDDSVPLRDNRRQGVLISKKHPEVGPVLTVLMSIPGLRDQVLCGVGEDDVEFWDGWWKGTPQPHRAAPPAKHKKIELARLAAFLMPHNDRLHASVGLLEDLLPEKDFQGLANFLRALTELPGFNGGLLSTLKLADGTAVETPCLIIDGDGCSSFDEATDAYFWPYGPCAEDERSEGAEAVRLAPVLCVECTDSCPIQENWFPQRYTEQFAPYVVRARERMADINNRIVGLRRERLALSAYQGVDIVKMLENANSTLKDCGETDAALEISSLAKNIQTKRLSVADSFEDLTECLNSIPQGVRHPDTDFCESLDMSEFEYNPYILSGVVISDALYYVKTRESWQCVEDSIPSESSFDEVQKAAEQQPHFLAVFATAPLLNTGDSGLPASLADFCRKDADALDRGFRTDEALDDGIMSSDN